MTGHVRDPSRYNASAMCSPIRNGCECCNDQNFIFLMTDLWKRLCKTWNPELFQQFLYCTAESSLTTLKRGSIHLITGCMYAQKTDQLLRRVKIQRLSSAIQGTSCLLIKHCFDDTRYLIPSNSRSSAANESMNPSSVANFVANANANSKTTASQTAVITHDKKYDTDCVSISNLRDINDLVKTKEYLFIDEGQFFEDLDLVIYWCLMGKTITIAALDADSNQRLWPSVQRIMPYCSYGQQTACCDICGHANATLSIAIQPSHSNSHNQTNPIKIGGKESFNAMCVHCKYRNG